jgi:FkbM family methyltransferase
MFRSINNYYLKLKRSFWILRFTNFRKYRPNQLFGKIEYIFNKKKVVLEGDSVWSMIEEIVISDGYCLKQQKNPSVIFDIGANIGVFTAYAATRFPLATIYAFEPFYETYCKLVQNTSKFENVKVYNVAITGTTGKRLLSSGQDSTAVCVITELGNAIVNLHECESLTLKDICKSEKIQYIDFLKIDCEGSEYEILSGDIETVGVVSGEYHEYNGNNKSDLFEILFKKEFYIKKISPFPDNKAGLFIARRK